MTSGLGSVDSGPFVVLLTQLKSTNSRSLAGTYTRDYQVLIDLYEPHREGERSQLQRTPLISVYTVMSAVAASYAGGHARSSDPEYYHSLN